MPKGEHFKKPNPRIIQVSFKVNQKEFDQLQDLLQKEGVNAAEWFRKNITSYGEQQSQPVAAETQMPKIEKAAPRPAAPPAPKKPVQSVPGGSKKDQMSLF